MVCDETFNRSTRSEITCRACGISCCKSCAREYVTSSIKHAHCMNCKAPWDRGFLVEHLNKSFVEGAYKDTRKEVLCQREQARFPETMEHVEHVKKKLLYENLRDTIFKKKTKYQIKHNNLHKIMKNEEDENIKEIIQNKMSVLCSLLVDIKEMEYTKRILKKELQDKGLLKKRTVTFIHACPKEGCKGFLSTAWKCGVCENWTCPHCFELKGPMKDDPDHPHVCKEENVKSAELIKKSTKNCPKCAVPIFKISGCDQMYCTECHIAFSWNSGEIETGAIHNPHYFQIQREMNEKLTKEARQALENNVNRNVCGPCGDDNMPNVHLYYGILQSMRENNLLKD